MASKATIHGAKAEGIFWVYSQDGKRSYGQYRTMVGARHAAKESLKRHREFLAKEGLPDDSFALDILEYIGIEGEDNTTGKYIALVLVRETVRQSV